MSAESDLINLIDQHFNKDELRELCLELNIEYESLSGENKRRKTQEFVTYTKRHNLSAKLISTVADKRPFLKSQLETINLPQINPTKRVFNGRLAVLAGFGIAIMILLGFGLWSAYSSITTATETAVPTTAAIFIYQIRILEKNSENPLDNAKIIIELPGTVPIDLYSDTNGIVAFKIGNQFDGKNVFLRVRKDGYEHWDQNINIAADERPYEVQLEPVP